LKQVNLAEKNTPGAQIFTDSTRDQIFVAAAEINMMTSATAFPESLQDVEQDSVHVPRYSSRTLPSNRSARHRVLQDQPDSLLMSHPPNIVPVGGIPCDLIPRNNSNRPTQLPFADILQDINMTAAQNSETLNNPTMTVPNAQSMELSVTSIAASGSLTATTVTTSPSSAVVTVNCSG